MQLAVKAVVDRLARITDVLKVVVLVSLGQHRKSDFERVEGHGEKHDEIVGCIATGGGVDYVMTVVTPSLADRTNAHLANRRQYREAANSSRVVQSRG